jgi:hypothetical protein
VKDDEVLPGFESLKREEIGPIKYYRIHNCAKSHKSFRTLANCIWKRAHGVSGEGSFALLHKCGHYHGGDLCVWLFPTEREARDQIPYGGCYDCNSRDYKIIRLCDPKDATQRAKD